MQEKNLPFLITDEYLCYWFIVKVVEDVIFLFKNISYDIYVDCVFLLQVSLSSVLMSKI